MHFHPYQAEWIQVLEGRLSVDIEGKELILTPEHGEFRIQPWESHRLYPPPNDGSELTKFILSGAKTAEAYRLDTLFFSNWYGYQDEIVMMGKRPDPIQVISVCVAFLPPKRLLLTGAADV
jgi:hypothetical protein